MDDEEAAKYLERAKDLVELATKIRSEEHRKLLIELAEKFVKLAMQVLGPEPQR